MTARTERRKAGKARCEERIESRGHKSGCKVLRAIEAQNYFFLLDAAWVRSQAERFSVSYTKLTGIIARTDRGLKLLQQGKKGCR